MTIIDLTKHTLIPTQEALKECTGRRLVGKIFNTGRKGYSYMIKYDSGKNIVEMNGNSIKE